MTRKLADLTRRTRRGRLYQKIVRAYRVPRLLPHPDSFAFSDPAPDWLWMLARHVLEYTEFEKDAGEKFLLAAITWCRRAPPYWSAGEREADAEVRSRFLRENRDEPEPSRGPMSDSVVLLALAYKLREVASPPGSRVA
jgi:hypothetical protein